jgi:magnesium-transporting ATPase (P-type)
MTEFGKFFFLFVGLNDLLYRQVPADARLVKLLSSTLSLDEGSLTGESTTVSKSLVDPPSNKHAAAVSM